MDPGIKFRNSGDEILLASASIVGKDGGVIRAKAFAYRGVFSCLQFNKSPKALRGSKLSDFVVANDPEWIGDLIPASREWTGVVQRWADLANVQSTAAPLPLERRNRILGALDVKLPAEYLDAIDQSEGLIVGPIQISGLSSIGSNPLPEGELVTLAQTPDGVIGVVSPGGELGYQTEDGLAFPPEPFGALVAGLLPARQRPS